MSNDNNNWWNDDKFKKFLAAGAVGAGLLFIYNMSSGADGAQTPRPAGLAYYDTIINAAKQGEVAEIEIQGRDVIGRYKSGMPFRSYIPEGDANVVKELRDSGVKIVSHPPQATSGVGSFLMSMLPVLLLVGVWIYFMKNMQGRGGGVGGFGKSKAKLRDQTQGRVTFDDVAGIEEAREDLEDIVDFLKDPQRYQRLGGNIPKGGLLVGPPGTGKTLIARAVAGEANVPFFTISGSDFVEMFVGVGASRVRDMFEQAKKNSPCIIFIDEIDAVGRKRGSGMGGGNEEREQTLNQLLVEMDGFEKTDSIIILAATNRVDVLDPALLRPGRFDRQIEVPNPDVGGREKILKVHMRKSPISPDVDVKIIARGTSGFSGAELANLVNEAALLAAKRNKRLVTQVEFEDAREKMIMGPEKKSSVVSDKVKKLVAYHEAGHVIPVIHLKDESEPVHKVTIIGRRGAGGYMARMPNENDPMDEIKMKANMVIAAGGRIAEELMLGRRGPGASADIAMVTDMARAMVTQYGFSDKVGFVRHAGGQREVLGQIVGQSAEISQETQRLIDEEVKRLSDEAYAKCREILQSNQDQLINVAEALIEFESLTGAEAEAAALAAPGKGKEAVKTLRDRKPIGSSILSGVYGSVPTTKPNPPAPANDSLG